ncbi:hypothetical protein BDY19DRAFT_985826 [Irpex rosettiformis]|uniref:Uncharacterized protein n=1 Tax=Irpex rosettiformis TaxID=378272 RepID=A0ACB8U093_9APHY|nr:hypothetical protein BDY19DRAFT_985826 [Irpex rosettiformis]
MSAIVEAFKIKPFDLEPIYATWPSAPIFSGNPMRDVPVDDWLKMIKEGCLARKVPKEYWHKVGQRYLGPHAKARFDELKAVMRNMHGGRYNWNWKRFKIAMRNMGWEIDAAKTEEIKVQTKPSGVWWIIGKRGEEKEKDSDSVSVDSVNSAQKNQAPVPGLATKPTPKRAMSWDFSSFKGFPTPKRSSTMSEVDTMSTISSTSTLVNNSEKTTACPTPNPSPAGTPGATTTSVAQAPTWLLNASQALGFLTTEHPKAMTAISAVLITIGSIPAIPAISAGAGGAFLASGTAHAIGSIAVGVGSLLKAVSESQQPPAAPAKS